MTTALVLEDEPLIAMDMETTLREAGFEVSTVGSCAEASEWLGVRRPDVVIVDILLRDEPSGAVVEHIIANGIPSSCIPAMSQLPLSACLVSTGPGSANHRGPTTC